MTVVATYERDGTLPIEDDEHACYVQVGDGQWVVLSGSARAIWNNLAMPQTFDALLGKLLDQYTGEPAQIAADLEATLGEWRRRGLVYTADDG